MSIVAKRGQIPNRKSIRYVVLFVAIKVLDFQFILSLRTNYSVNMMINTVV